MSSAIRELTKEECSQVNGGVLPVLAAVGSFFGHTAVRSVTSYYLNRSLTAYAVYSAAESVSDMSEE